MNPLLDTSGLPRFTEIEPGHAVPAIRQLIAAHRQKLELLLDSGDRTTFDVLIPPLEEMSHEFGRVWSPVSHLHNVLADQEWREAYNECLPLVTEYYAELGQNSRLQRSFRAIRDALPADADEAAITLVDHALRDFRLAGVALDEDKKSEFRELKQELAASQALFEQNVQDATDAWSMAGTDDARLDGLPDQIIARAREDADGDSDALWRLRLDFPNYQAVITHAEDRELRREFYRAWITRASDQADDSQWDNADVIENIMSLRQRIAELVGFDTYADYSLATKMAGSVDEVTGFISELSERSRRTALDEYAALEALAGFPIEAWDVAYYLEKYREARYAVSAELLRSYFPVSRVVPGLFSVAEKLYGIRVTVDEAVATWDDNVSYYRVENADGSAIGGFYVDLFARPGKRGGAWIDECIVRKELNGSTVLPVGYLVCNFPPPDADGVSLLRHDDVVTLFHEFGHMLHHLLTRVSYPSIAGINGVPWDAVELPSQFMENFAWSYGSLSQASGHFETGEPLPREVFDRLAKSRYCGAGLAMLRQLEFALYDIRLHAGFDPARGANTLPVLDAVRNEVAVVRHPEFNRFPMSFSHIFAGGYAAGYYSYKWAEVLAADAFGAFEENGIFDAGTAERFRSEILEIGGSRDIMQAFIAFRGRKPKIDALLRQSGIGIAA